MATRGKQFPGRIKTLESVGLITPEQAGELLRRAREVAKLMVSVRPKLGNVAPEFMTTRIEYAKCRSLRHWWDTCPPVLDYRPIGGTPEYFRCQRCSMVRIDIWNIRGDRNRTRYLQPVGYKFTGSEKRLNGRDWHILRRWLEMHIELELIEIQQPVPA